MKASVSVASEPARSADRSRQFAAGVALVWLAAHLPFLSPSLEDLDSINFALGLHDFDPAAHQPHPPGYPVYVVIGRVALAVIGAVAPGLVGVEADALVLAVWSGLGGMAAILGAAALFREITASTRSDEGRSMNVSIVDDVPVWGAALMAVAPLFWLSGLRPMSDMPGLAAALWAEALLLRGRRESRALVGGALLAGVGIGIRVQVAWLTLPLLAYVAAGQRGPGAIGRSARALGVSVVGGLLWMVPLVAATGGVEAYLTALGSQGGEDFAWVTMLWSDPTPRHLAFALVDTLVMPWHDVWLGGAVLALACLGVLSLLFRDRRTLLLLTVTFAPYAVFHLVLQDTAMLRYALPLVPPLAYLAVRAGHGIPSVFMASRPASRRLLIVVPLVVLTAWRAVPAGLAYGSERHPAFRAIADMHRAERPAAVYAHYAVRRPLQAAGGDLPVIEPRRNYEWLGPADYWRNGGRGVIWFLADPRRTDLALITRQRTSGWSAPTQYRWGVESRAELQGTRPMGVDWYRLSPPDWFVGEGWALTPETGGLARADGTGVDRRPITAFVRRRPGPMKVLVAGRDTGSTPGDTIAFDLAIEGTSIERWTFTPQREGRNFFRLVALPGGAPAGSGDYARLTIAARPATPGASMPEVAIRQFDIQPERDLIWGFAEGWHEAEYELAQGRQWRWSSERSLLRIDAPSAVSLRVRGESPAKYQGRPVTVRVLAAERLLAEFSPRGDFDERIHVPAAALAASDGLVAVETDPVYLPGVAEGTGDARRLGLRVFELDVRPVSGQ